MYNKDQTSNEGRKMEEVMSQNGLHEEINKTTHISNNFPSCTDLILTLNLNKVRLYQGRFFLWE